MGPNKRKWQKRPNKLTFLDLCTYALCVSMLLTPVILAIPLFQSINHRKYIESQPTVSRESRIVTKRLYVGGSSNTTNTRYYITFEFSDGKRVEYLVTSEEYGLLVEGDKGKLSTQADEYKEFKRLILP